MDVVLGLLLGEKFFKRSKGRGSGEGSVKNFAGREAGGFFLSVSWSLFCCLFSVSIFVVPFWVQGHFLEVSGSHLGGHFVIFP